MTSAAFGYRAGLAAFGYRGRTPQGVLMKRSRSRLGLAKATRDIGESQP
uniref:Uncharacterized protein n=1 Tax=Picea glauca TaxID=3330 RepID=A0A101LZG5_PICGL|nr:hypothetical protein ABT39_MTgene5054 [Picea glauca]